MQYRRFGRTEIQMPVISTGGMRYQDGWKDKPLAEVDPAIQTNLENTIARSIEVGINHIETARGYGVSERQLGTVLPTYPRDEITVQTKVSPDPDGKVFEENFRDSLKRLRLGHVDLLGIHGINNEETLDWATRPGGCLEAARRLIKEGLVKHVGFSTHGYKDIIVQAIETEAFGGFDYVNLHYYFIFQRNREAIQAAAKSDMGVFIISPSDKGGLLYKPSQTISDLCKPLHPIVFNDLWCLRHPEIHTLSLGAAKPSDYDLHLEAVKHLDQTDALLPPIEQALAAAMKQAIGHDSPEAMSWQGVPEFFNTPGGHNIPLILWLNHLVKGWGLDEYAKMRFNMLGSASHWFPGRKAEEVLTVPEPVLEKIVQSSPYAKQIPALLREAVERLHGEQVQRLSQSD